MELIKCVYFKTSKIIYDIGNDLILENGLLFIDGALVEENSNFDIIELEDTFSDKIIFKNGWYYLTVNNNIELTQLGSTELKQILIQKIADNRYNKELAGYEYKNGRLFYTDRETQTKYTSVYVAARDNLIQELEWKTMDSSFITLNKAEIIELAVNVMAYVQYLFNKESSIRDQIDSANSFSDMINIDVSF